MSDFAQTWLLIRQRFDDSVVDLRADQLNWRLHAGALTCGEMALHVAGVELSFVTQLLGTNPDPETERLIRAATDGSVNSLPFPFGPDEITPVRVAASLQRAREAVHPIITDLTPGLRVRPVKSALGPMTDGTGAMARIAYHPGYHQGQVYLVRTAPNFPT